MEIEEGSWGTSCHLQRKSGCTRFIENFSREFLDPFFNSCHVPNIGLPKLLFANARSAVNKLEFISSTLSQQNINCLALAETWFNESHSEDMTHFSDFSCFRDDRPNKIGGGVAIWARTSLYPHVFNLENKPSYIEAVSVCVMYHIYIICVYVPPVASVRSACREDILRFLTDSVDKITCLNAKSEVVICGDFNRFPVGSLCNVCNLTSMFSGSTYNGHQLDYILMTEALCEHYSVNEEAPIDNSKTPHVSLMAKPHHNGNTFFSATKNRKVVYDTRQSHVSEFVKLLHLADWSSINDKEKSIDTKTECFHRILQDCFTLTIPSYEVEMSSHEKPWMTPLIKHLINQRWEAFRSRDFAKYNHFKTKVKLQIAKTKTAWITRNHKKDIWKTVKLLSGKSASDPVANFCSQYDSETSAANALNDTFSSHFQISAKFCSSSLSQWPSPQVPLLFVYHHLCRLDSKKSSPDLPSKLYKAAAHIIAEPLTSIFNESLASGKVPFLWKRASVSPIPKCSNPTIDDFRPISLLPIPVKILERFVLDSIKPTILSHYGKNQFGFRPRSSTTSALIAIDDFITSSLDRKDVIGVQMVAYDLSKAFDKLKYDVILSTLSASTLPPSFVSWFCGYFENRTQFVRIGAAKSTLVQVTSGVPQGSVIGPFIFSMIAGTFPVDFENATVIKYADDFTVCAALLKMSTNDHVLHLHNSFLKWSADHGLTVNKAKCKTLFVSFKHVCSPITLPNVSVVDELKILGVIFNRRLNWSSHCDTIVKNASRRLYILRVLKNVVTSKDLIKVYNAIVRSRLEYASPLFVGLSSENSRKLDRVQKRFHRLLCGHECRDECLVPLERRRIDAAVKLFRQSDDVCHVLHHLVVRKSSTGRYLLPVIATTRRLKSFFPCVAIHMNRVHIRQCPL